MEQPFEGSSRQIETTEDLENTRVSPHQPKIHEFFPRLAHPQPSFQPRPTAGPLSHGPTCIRTPVQSILYDFFPPHRVHDDETARDNCIDPAVSPSSSTMERGFSSEDDMGDALEVAGENNREKGHRKAEGRGEGHEREKSAKRVRRDFLPTTKSKGRVEYFIDQVLSNPFVSLEAEVDRDAEEDDDEDVTGKFIAQRICLY
ncbi:hypothetical protein H0H81_007683 [Sphagnurus paluster]|uniref:Uncharacterized protein n=1 Tax=Sphagnurus paluster TaxID=117069 RepID=A0A9P7FM56_9AGAR|nr:hypothetical protein H0H81_007683 [Sphagnurus paluster]